MIAVDIEQRLGDFRLAVRFEAEAPVVGLFGRSGAGKTSVVNAIAGIARPERGSIHVDGAPLFDAERGIDVPVERRRVGYVFQDALLFPHLDVESNLLYGQRRRAASECFVDESRVVDLLGLRALLRRRPATLSGGEKQRVAIGRALLAQPRILLMDEPLAALDGARKSEILDYVERLRSDVRIPIVYVTHSVAEIARLADTVVVLSAGRCVMVGDVDDVLSHADVLPVAERYDAASVLDARVVAHDDGDSLTIVAFDGGELVVPRIRAARGERVRLRVRARDVSLSRERPAAISVLNVLAADVVAVDDGDRGVVDVRLALGGAPLVARITRRSLRELAIAPGDRLYALVKTVSFEAAGMGHA